MMNKNEKRFLYYLEMFDKYESAKESFFTFAVIEFRKRNFDRCRANLATSKFARRKLRELDEMMF